jgi:hypothetical protein
MDIPSNDTNYTGMEHTLYYKKDGGNEKGTVSMSSFMPDRVNDWFFGAHYQNLY